MVIIMYPIITPLTRYFIYGNYNVPYYNAADQCIRLSPKMASFAAEIACVAGGFVGAHSSRGSAAQTPTKPPATQATA